MLIKLDFVAFVERGEAHRCDLGSRRGDVPRTDLVQVLVSGCSIASTGDACMTRDASASMNSRSPVCRLGRDVLMFEDLTSNVELRTWYRLRRILENSLGVAVAPATRHRTRWAPAASSEIEVDNATPQDVGGIDVAYAGTFCSPSAACATTQCAAEGGILRCACVTFEAVGGGHN